MNKPSIISASPVKSFFVHWLIRDIGLRDAILDLLDNCVDGVQRSASKKKLDRKQPYRGYWARIEITGDEFIIKDNCGGIPWDLRGYAFRMGCVKQDIIKGRRMIGTYGIGMKRAIFKLGTDCNIETHAKDGSYRIHLSPEWMEDEKTWDLEAEEISTRGHFGTSIQVSKLHPAVSRELESKSFRDAFYNAVATHYAYIIDKGFEVYLNDKLIKPKRIRLLFSLSEDSASSRHKILPFIYEAQHMGVDIFLAVGFTRTIPSKEEAEASLEDYKERYSSAEAGWTIVCNDRTIVYCDKTALTGWGVSGVPHYHMQFIAISGIVVFRSDDARNLPMKTTKRGLDAGSELYMHVKDKMIEGIKIFTGYTNAWKGKELVKESREMLQNTSSAGIEDLQEKSKRLQISLTRGFMPGKQYKPKLPQPKSTKTHQRISFMRPSEEIRRVSKYLFDTPDKKAAEVGDECFRLVHEDASQ